MPYDGTVERQEFIMRDYDRRDYREDYDWREREPPRRRPTPVERIAAVVNDPEVVLPPNLVKIINDPDLVMDSNGEVMKKLTYSTPPTNGFRSKRSRGDFSMVSQFPFQKPKRTRKKTKTDRTMSSCLKQANAKGKLKNGKFRKGWDQSRIMTYAHKLCRKEMGTKKGMVRKTARRAYEKK